MIIVSHDFDEKVLDLVEKWAPYAPSRNLVMLFPSTQSKWDDEAYTGPRYNTKNGIQPLFIKNLIEQVTRPIDEKYDYNEIPKPQPEDMNNGGNTIIILVVIGAVLVCAGIGYQQYKKQQSKNNFFVYAT